MCDKCENSATVSPAPDIHVIICNLEWVRNVILAILMDVPPVMMSDVVFLVKWVEILNQWEVSRAGVICLHKDFFSFVIAFRVNSFDRGLKIFLA